jgi:hypothetical protein
MTFRITWQSVKFILGVALLIAQGAAQALAGPFGDLAGNWSGEGALYRASGQNERLRCRASYDVKRDGDQVNLRIQCAGDSYKFDLSGYVINSCGAISGQWSEPNYNSAGTLTGRASAGSISAQAIGNTFSAQISVITKGTRQSVTIQPQETDVTRASLDFRKN